MEMIICPRCDEQGLVKRIFIKPLSIEGYLCDECEAFWFKKEGISFEKFVGFRNFLDEKGLKYNSTEIEFLDRV